AVLPADSDAADVDRLLVLFTPEGRYVHLRYEADFDLAAWRAAFLGNIARGAFTAAADACIAITNHIPGDGVAAVEYAYGTRGPGGGCEPAEDGRLLALFHLEGGRIGRVEELWCASVSPQSRLAASRPSSSPSHAPAACAASVSSAAASARSPARTRSSSVATTALHW